MNLDIEGHRILVCGASSGFGRAIAETLLKEGAYCIVTARRQELLEEIYSDYPLDQVTTVPMDLTEPDAVDRLVKYTDEALLHGVVLNAGGPATGTPLKTTMSQWDEVYQLVMRWKIELATRLAPVLAEHNYGRMLFIESQSVKQPLPSLVLSNAFRAGVTSFAKSLALEVADRGVTINVIAPGSHNTPAIERVIKNRSESEQISMEEARERMEASIPVGRMGEAEELASLAAWLMSPLSGFVTGQTISHDGGTISGIFG